MGQRSSNPVGSHGRLGRLVKVLMVVALAASIVPCAGATLLSTTPATPSTNPATASTAAKRIGPTDPAEVEGYFDQLLGDSLKEWNAPGGVAVVVRDGKVLLCKGYGLADVEAGRAFDARRTRFPAGSISKYVTALTLMQLVDEGRVRLDAPIDDYLPKKLRPINRFRTPLTLGDCLTYSAGFEANYLGFAAHEPPGAGTLERFVADSRLVVTHEPGTVSGYCNEGHALAGYVIERVTGRPFETYVRDHLFAPLGMIRSGYRHDSEPQDCIAIYGQTGKGGLANGLGTDDTARFWRHPQPFHVRAAPAAGLYTSAADLANLMRMLLGDGKFEAKQVVATNSVGQLLERYLRGRPRNSEVDPALLHIRRNGQDCAQQGGGWPGFSGKMVLFPETRTGFFVGLMRYDGRVNEGLVAPLMDHYYPVERAMASLPTEADLPALRARHRRLAGEYLAVSRVRSNFTQLETVLRPTVVSCEPDGALRIGEARFVEVAKGAFQKVDDGGKLHDDRAAFAFDSRGVPTRMFLGTEAYDRATLVETSAFNRTATRGFLIGSLGLGIAGPVTLIVPWVLRLRRPRGEESLRLNDLLRGAADADPLAAVVHTMAPARPESRSGVRMLPWLALAAGLLNAGFLITFRTALKNTSLLDFLYGTPPAVSAALKIPPVSAYVALVLLIFVVRAWRTPGVGLLTRIQYALTALVATAFIPYLAYWNLLIWPTFTQ